MAEAPQRRASGFSVRGHHPFIGIVREEDGEEVTYYLTDEESADAATPESVTQAALGAIGAWRDLDWDDMVEALDRIRHQTPPTPPIDDPWGDTCSIPRLSRRCCATGLPPSVR